MKRRSIEQYELERRLGEGGSGVVYLANDTQLMRPVALKVLKRCFSFTQTGGIRH